MQWEHLTAPDFAAAVHQTGVCIIATGVLERHSEHLPLGTDFLNGHRIAELAAQREPALVFPYWYFAQIHEARHCPGTIAIDPVMVIQLFLELFSEISRNGCHKIILKNAHGGNRFLLSHLAEPVPAVAASPVRVAYAIRWIELGTGLDLPGFDQVSLIGGFRSRRLARPCAPASSGLAHPGPGGVPP